MCDIQLPTDAFASVSVNEYDRAGRQACISIKIAYNELIAARVTAIEYITRNTNTTIPKLIITAKRFVVIAVDCTIITKAETAPRYEEPYIHIAITTESYSVSRGENMVRKMKIEHLNDI